MNTELLKTKSPAYYFDLDAFNERVLFVKEYLKDIPLTYSIKANPFLLHHLPSALKYVEVCSPGELSICKKANIDPKRILYSGVNKEYSDIEEAIAYGVDLTTAESLKHLRLENEVAKKLHKTQKVILRLTSGNQFGMSEEDVMYAIEHKEEFAYVNLYGIHYYSGTQKKTKKIQKDLLYLDEFLTKLNDLYNFKANLVEYGPGLTVEYFKESFVEDEVSNLIECKELLETFARKYPVGVEMGRYLACSCGTYVTKIMDLKTNDGVNYVICDGGIHHIKYYGQSMAMKIPPIKVLNTETSKEHYCLCGSLCTTADVLVRDVELPKLQLDDLICFGRCGAYSVTENSALFLSRNMPSVYIYNNEIGLKEVRVEVPTSIYNY